MALPATLLHTGLLNGSPAQSSQSIPSLNELINTTFQVTLGSSKGGRPSIVGATDGVPFVLSLETITKVRVIAMRVSGGSLKVKLTSASGTDQAINVSNMLLWFSPNAGDEVTAIKLVGTADLEYILAGDVS